MESVARTMYIESNKAIISKYEIMKAFFLTEEEENVNMAHELNKMINVFCEQERQTKRNVTTLSFDIEPNKQVIDYIKKACV